ncbi:DMT family transporter [Streptomyces sp. MUSC 14]|uniref:DMT family transporter n=1 Tax=Streptomyces sp. MUSC 14 TaxID=1354889 RepID=UPI0009A0F5CE|nr:DMT family transporter [Streptomyces sp. MUSC 14]
MSALALSVLLSVVSALAYAGGAIVQEQVAVSCPDSAYMPLRRPSWWGALALNGLGGVLHVVALAYGPLSLVQPLGALTIVFALPMAALFVGRGAGATAWRGAVMATVGLAGLLSLVGSTDTHSLDTAQRITVVLVTGGATAGLTLAGLAAHRHPAVRSVLLATASGIAFGMSSVFTKAVAEDWTRGIDLHDLPSLAVIVVFAGAGVVLSQASYRGAGLAAPLATLTVVNPVLAAAVGILMFGETFRYGGVGSGLAISCGVVAAGGLVMLTTERIARTGPPAAGDTPTPGAGPEAAAEAPAGLPPQRVPVPGEAEPPVPAEDGAGPDAPAGPDLLVPARVRPVDPAPGAEPAAGGGADSESGEPPGPPAGRVFPVTYTASVAAAAATDVSLPVLHPNRFGAQMLTPPARR